MKVEKWGDGRAYVRVNPRVAQLIAGEIDLSELDDEELMRGQLRAKDGTFRGRAPSVVPREIYAEWARRQMESGFQDMLGDLRSIVETVRNIATDPNVDNGTRLRAAEMVMDRVYGKPREAVDISVGEAPRHEQMISAVTIDRDLPAEDEDIVDAEVVDWEQELNEWAD